MPADAIPFQQLRMSEAQYDAERQRLRKTYGDSTEEAGVRWEQALATLFAESGWTQQELAEKEGNGQQWMSRQLRFGRFLIFAGSTPSGRTLTERAFRDKWQSAVGGDELERFRKVAAMIENPDLAYVRRKPTHGATKAITDAFADGEWHTDDEIRETTGLPRQAMTAALEAIRAHTRPGFTGERRKYGTGWQHRIFRTDRTVSSVELKTKLTPILKGLVAESKKSTVTMSPGTVALLAHELNKLLKEWTE